MSRWRPTSLKRRLLFNSALIIVTALTVTVGMFLVYDVRTMHGQMVRDLEVLAEVVGDNCMSALVFDAPETAEKNLASLQREYQIRSAVLYDANGYPFAHYRRPDAGPATTGSMPGVRLPGMAEVEVSRSLRFDGRTTGTIVIEATMEELSRQLARYLLVALVLMAAALAVTLLLAQRLQQRVSRPILELAAKTRDISRHGDYSMRIGHSGLDHEIAQLFGDFNAMLAQIEHRDGELRDVRATLEEANRNLRELALEISRVGELEKRRLAGELHDSPMHKLALA